MAAELEAGEAKLSASQVDIESFLNRLVSAFGHKAQEKRITVEVRGLPGAEGPRPLFTTDPEKLRLVCANLFANALEFTPEGTRVIIEVQIQDRTLHLSVLDEGSGIPESERKRLFERFHQLEQGPTKRHRGHGLGLSITKALVEVLGGKVSVEKAPNAGTLVRVMVPELASPGADIFSEDGNEFLFHEGSSF
jgi:signal transduction histidine kinase